MTELDLKDGKIFLNKVTEKIRTRLTEVDASIDVGSPIFWTCRFYL